MPILPILNVPSLTINLGLLASFNKTSLDLEDSSYIYTIPPSVDTTTNYPSLATGTPSIFANPSFAHRFFQKYYPRETYLERYPIQTSDSKFLEDLGYGQTTFDITNFDVENDNPDGFYSDDISTTYGVYSTGTPTLYANPSYPQRFSQPFFPDSPYLDSYSIAGNSRFTDDLGNGATTLNITNFDVENDNPDGFYSRDISTAYGVYVTGTPTIYTNPSYPQRFSQPFFPDQQYLDKYSIAGNSRFTEDLGNGLNSLDISNFDVEKIDFNTIQDTITNYPPLATGTPNVLSNPGPANQFIQTWDPSSTYLNSYPIKGESKFTEINRYGKNTLDMTDLDTSAPGVNGGIPYDQQKDPTIYPLTTNGATPVRGYFATAGKPVSKFNQVYSQTSTYSDFISAYI